MPFNRYQPDTTTVEYKLVFACGAGAGLRLVRSVVRHDEPLTIDLDKDAVVDLTYLHRSPPSAHAM